MSEANESPRPYSVQFTPAAARQWRRLTRQVQAQLQPLIDGLAANPRPANCIMLSGSNDYRVRSGDYRIIYSIRDADLIVLVVRVGNRREVYR